MKNDLLANRVAIKSEDEQISERARYLADVAKAIADTKARYPRIGSYVVVMKRRIEETATFVVDAEDKEQASQVALEACEADSWQDARRLPIGIFTKLSALRRLSNFEKYASAVDVEGASDCSPA
jgi:hypothetical protein